jgi:hypothetical protein
LHSCSVPGCSLPVTRWSKLCNTHKARQRRHGHPRQEGVTKAELEPFAATVRERKKRNAASPLWAKLDARWQATAAHCQDVIAAYAGGQAMNRNDRQACEEIVKLAREVESTVLAEAALALFLMREQRLNRFLSDDAFWFQLTRRLRALADVNVGTWFDHKAGKVKRVYRDLPPKTTLAMGKMLAETFGLVGLLLARREEEDQNREREEAEALAQAVRDLA